MNTERMLLLAEEIEKHQVLDPEKFRFNMSTVDGDFFRKGINRRVEKVRECGAAACAAGITCIIFCRPGDEMSITTAEQLLSLTHDEGRRLFIYGYGLQVDLSRVPRSRVAEEIRQMVAEYQASQPTVKVELPAHPPVVLNAVDDQGRHLQIRLIRQKAEW